MEKIKVVLKVNGKVKNIWVALADKKEQWEIAEAITKLIDKL